MHPTAQIEMPFCFFLKKIWTTLLIRVVGCDVERLGFIERVTRGALSISKFFSIHFCLLKWVDFNKWFPHLLKSPAWFHGIFILANGKQSRTEKIETSDYLHPSFNLLGFWDGWGIYIKFFWWETIAFHINQVLNLRLLEFLVRLMLGRLVGGKLWRRSTPTRIG